MNIWLPFTKYIIEHKPFHSDWIAPDSVREYRIQHHVFHHTLAPSSDGMDSWGKERYRFCTDANGFKSDCEDTGNEQQQFNIAFIGDSFTEAIGMRYEDSFVGMFAKDNPNLSVANLGVSSYSPTVYFSKVNWLLDNGYFFDHLYVFVDISDIQDESLYSRDPSGNVLLDTEECFARYCGNSQELKEIKNTIKTFVKKHFYLFSVGYSHLKKLFVQPQPISDNVFTKGRSEWTYNPSSLFYGSNGVAGSIEKALTEMIALHELLETRGIKLSVGVYPWPAQLVELKNTPEQENRQSQIWSSFCEHRCENYIDLFPTYRGLIAELGIDEVYERYFMRGDVHFNARGNKLVFNAIGKEY